VELRKINFLKSLLIYSAASPWWRLFAKTQIYASPNHSKVMKAESSRESAAPSKACSKSRAFNFGLSPRRCSIRFLTELLYLCIYSTDVWLGALMLSDCCIHLISFLLQQHFISRLTARRFRSGQFGM